MDLPNLFCITIERYLFAMEESIEIWKDITGYEGLYQVSNLGRVKSLKYKRSNKEKIIKSYVRKLGYLAVSLYKENKFKIFSIHRLVAQAFVPNPNNLPCINHKDENPSNNIWTNLEWCTYEYNNNYGAHNIRQANTKSKPIKQISLDGTVVKIWPSALVACKENEYNRSSISFCCKGIRKTHKGYLWAYLVQK